MLTILFVDDEPMLLEGLRRALRGMRDAWNMLFATSGLEALRLLEDRDVDVIVSDMRMPELDGRQLLRAVKDRHPRIARLMLSGHAEQASLLEAVGCVQQFLAKPCDVATLQSTISRTLALRTLLQERTAGLNMAPDTLPALPSAYEDLVRCVQGADASIKEAAVIIARDPSLTATLLKVSNSAFFGPPKPVTTIERACSFLGMEIIAALVLSGTVVSAYPQLFGAGGALARWPDHSLRVATMARDLAIAEKLPETKVNQAFLAGLLHDIGFLVLAMHGNAGTTFAGGEAAMTEPATDDHAIIGAYLLASWGFPDPIVEGVAWHHTAARHLDASARMAQMVYIADRFAFNPDLSSPESAGIDAGLIAQADFAARWPVLQRAAMRTAAIDGCAP